MRIRKRAIPSLCNWFFRPLAQIIGFTPSSRIGGKSDIFKMSLELSLRVSVAFFLPEPNWIKTTIP